MREDISWTTEKYWYAMEINGGIERFEWRHSHGDEVKKVGRSKWGWKLVRMNSDLAEGQVARTSDGKEVVAVWAPAAKSLTKRGEFQFLDGSSGEGLGDLWRLMAIFSLLCIVQKEMQASRRAAGVIATT